MNLPEAINEVATEGYGLIGQRPGWGYSVKRGEFGYESPHDFFVRVETIDTSGKPISDSVEDFWNGREPKLRFIVVDSTVNPDPTSSNGPDAEIASETFRANELSEIQNWLRKFI